MLYYNNTIYQIKKVYYTDTNDTQDYYSKTYQKLGNIQHF